MLGEEPNKGRKLTAGTREHNFEQYKYWIPIGSYSANDYTRSTNVVKGILKGLDENGKVEFNYPEPGFFEDSDATCTVKVEKQGWFGSYKENETRYLRKVYKDLKLGFEQKGDTYTLKNVKDQNGNTLTTEGADFYPLDGDRKLNYENSETAHNYFFGMRYDVSFKIGDYVGPMNYEFTGDDDLWMLLDGKLVLDLGGIHGAADGTVDIWEKLGKTADQLTSEEKEQEHTLTVLYMERGAGESNCKMKFTLPSASIAEVSQVPMAELNLQKVNKENEGLQGARFTLVNDETGETQTATSAGKNGNVNFTKLRVGTYTLREDAAPSGYIPSLDSWIVKVESDSNNTAIATLYLSDGTTPYTDKEGSYYQILNMTKEELINSSLDYNKTAKVIDWDKRTYQIGGTVGSVTFTNVKATKDWDIVKVSTSGNQVKLQGAKFELLKNNKPVYIGTSNDNGKIIWKKGKQTVTNLEPGEYVLRETKAPVGYVRSEETWSLSITKGGSLVSYTSEKTDSTIDTSTITESDPTLHLYFKNETAYALPSAGGTGIYLYMIGGILLMFAAVWILYKNKCKEVLEK